MFQTWDLDTIYEKKKSALIFLQLSGLASF